MAVRGDGSAYRLESNVASNNERRYAGTILMPAERNTVTFIDEPHFPPTVPWARSAALLGAGDATFSVGPQTWAWVNARLI